MPIFWFLVLTTKHASQTLKSGFGGVNTYFKLWNVGCCEENIISNFETWFWRQSKHLQLWNVDFGKKTTISNLGVCVFWKIYNQFWNLGFSPQDYSTLQSVTVDGDHERHGLLTYVTLATLVKKIIALEVIMFIYLTYFTAIKYHTNIIFQKKNIVVLPQETWMQCFYIFL